MLSDNRSNAQGSLLEHMSGDIIITATFGGVSSAQ